MALSYCGVYLPIQTAEHRMWLEQYAPWDLVKETEVHDWRGSNLLELNWPQSQPERKIEIGVLHWPTGASEHASFHCVVNSTKLDEIRDYIDANGQYQDLVLSEGNAGFSITASMKMLPPRPIHQIDDTEQLYLLSLVDKRFDWRWKSADITAAPASWSALYSAIGTAIGSTITPEAVDADYSVPSERWVQYRKLWNSLFDTAANSVQQRVVVALDGTVTTVNAATANAAAIAAHANVVKLIGGEVAAEDIQRYVPASVTVIFGKKTSGVWQADPYTVNKTLSSLSITEYGAATGISGLTAQVYADLVYDGTNSAACSTLATQAATDWYKWRLNQYEYVLPGIVNWTINGTESFVEWRYQDEGRLLTRIVLGPWQEIPQGNFNNTAGGGNTCGCDTGCGWLAGIRQTNCLLLSLQSATGACDCDDTLADLELVYDSGDWTTDDTWSICGVEHVPAFTITSGVPTLTLTSSGYGGTKYGVLSCCGTDDDGNRYAEFGFGNEDLCTGTESDTCGDNRLCVRLICSCCSIEGWDGAGWYCVENEEEVCEPVELLDEDRCDDTIIICSGPYATEEEAETVCGLIITSCCPSGIPRTLTATLTDVSGCSCLDAASFTLTYNPSITPPDIGLPGGAVCATGSGWAGSVVTCTGKTLQMAMFADICSNCFTVNGHCGTGDFNGGSGEDSYDCGSPFSAVFTVAPFASNCCSGSFTVTIEQ